MPKKQWQTFWTAVSAVATVAGVVAVVALNQSGTTTTTTTLPPPPPPPPPVDPYNLSQLDPQVALAAQQAREAQSRGAAGADSARRAAARGQAAAAQAASRTPGFVVLGSDPQWRGQTPVSGEMIYGVHRREGTTASGEFRYDERYAEPGNSPESRQIRFLPHLHVLQSSNGTYEGSSTSIDSQWAGPGRFVFENGDVFTGEWQPDAPTTFGVFDYRSGQRYEGEFEDIHRPGFDLQRHGVGVLWDANGQVLQAGRWNHGEFATE